MVFYVNMLLPSDHLENGRTRFVFFSFLDLLSHVCIPQISECLAMGLVKYLRESLNNLCFTKIRQWQELDWESRKMTSSPHLLVSAL